MKKKHILILLSLCLFGVNSFSHDQIVHEAITVNAAESAFNNSSGFRGFLINTSNTWSWQNARGYEWLGLTATNQLARQTNLDNMFRAVGQVMHLLEDTTQPQHVRNETIFNDNSKL